MIRLGLLGHPVSHSRSPAMHRAALQAAGLQGAYELVDVAPEKLRQTLHTLAEEGWTGVNVTVPHKEAVLSLCDEVDRLTQRVGAVNTVTFESGRLMGTNTDVTGFHDSLRATTGRTVSDSFALVLGAGGAARAAAVGLLDSGVQRLVLVNRDPLRAAQLGVELGVESLPLEYEALASVQPDLIVQATSAGNNALPGTQAWQEASSFLEHLPWEAWSLTTAFDLVYTPEDTLFLQRARAAGAHAVGGLDMLARQGALSFERWTQVPARESLPVMLSQLRASFP